MENNFDPNAPIQRIDFFDTPTFEELAQARVEEQKREHEFIAEYVAKNPLEADAGAADAEPSAMSFFNGRPYDEGLAAYNQYRLANGKPPISKGAR